MNLFDLTYERVTGNSARRFCDHTDQNLLRDLMVTAEAALKENSNFSDRFSKITDFLLNHSMLDLGIRNPEYFPSIVNLIAQSNNNTYKNTQLEHLETILNFRLPKMRPSQRFFRYLGKKTYIKSFNGTQWEPNTHLKVSRLPSSDWLVVQAHSGLYSDLFDQSLYPDLIGNCTFESALSMVEHALFSLSEYSSETSNDVKNALRVIAFTGDNGRPSFSYRLSYAGGIFLNPNFKDADFSESILHEYIHLRLWQWWAYDPVPGRDTPELMLISPMTGNTRSSFALLQALLIYVAVLDLKLALITHIDNLDIARLSHRRRIFGLVDGIPKLINLLMATFKNEKALAYIDVVNEIYQEIVFKQDYCLKFLRS